MPRRVKRSEILGDKKICFGPLHPDGEFISLERFYKRKTGDRAGQYYARCIDCQSHYAVFQRKKRNRSLVDIERVRFIFKEIVYRVGIKEAARASGVSFNTFAAAYYPNRGKVRKKLIQRKSVTRAMAYLRYLRENDIARHPKSIKHGAKARGRTERPKPLP